MSWTRSCGHCGKNCRPTDRQCMLGMNINNIEMFQNEKRTYSIIYKKTDKWDTKNSNNQSELVLEVNHFNAYFIYTFEDGNPSLKPTFRQYPVIHTNYSF